MGQLVTAYHGCDISTRDQLLRGLTEPLISKNPYDWLGNGFYFFQGDPDRALKFAQNAKAVTKTPLTRQPIATPAVIGAVLDVDRWLDFGTQAGIAEFSNAVATLEETGAIALELRNEAAFDGDGDKVHRNFDRAVCIAIHEARTLSYQTLISACNQTSEILDELKYAGASQTELAKAMDDFNRLSFGLGAMAPYQATRCPFEQSDLVNERSAIHTGSHIQIAVHDLSCIRGWFLVPGDKALTDAEFDAANKALLEARRNRTASKRRVRPDTKPSS